MRSARQWLVAGLAIATLAACGGGSSGTGAVPGNPQTAGAARGSMAKASATSITVNSVRYDVSGASVRIDDHGGTLADLKNGMMVRVKGTDDGTNGRASEVEVENEVRGAVTSVNAGAAPQFFEIGGIKVIVDSSTVFEDLVPASLAGIQVGVFVEVHGSRDGAGNLVATRVEGKGARDPNGAEVDELRGRIASVNGAASQFAIGTVVVTHSGGTVFTPAGRCSAASLAVGLLVEVHGAFTAADAFAATRIDCEDNEDENRRAGNGEHDSLEGFVANLDSNARTFTIDGQQVSYSTSTEFRNGTIDDLIDNAKVEVEGTLSGSTLVAREIKFKRTRVILTTAPTAVGALSLTLFDRVVQVNDLTEIRTQGAGGNSTSLADIAVEIRTQGAGGNSTSLADIAVNVDRVEVRAFLDGTTLIAERITEIGNSGGGRDIVQARVVAENEAAFTLGLLDAANPINVSLAGATFQNDDDQPITAAQFFAAVTAAAASDAGTLVKVKGQFSGGTLTAEEAELED